MSDYQAEMDQLRAETERVAAELIRKGEYPWRAWRKALDIVLAERRKLERAK